MNISSLQAIGRIPALSLGKTLNQASQSFKALSASLSSGDMASAQSSFNDLKKLLQSAGSIGAANSVKNDINALGKALGSGDIPSARQGLSQLQDDIVTALHPQPTRPSAGIAQSLLGGIKSAARFVA